MASREFTFKLVFVPAKYVVCALTLDKGGYRRCNRPATHAVEDDGYWWRCTEHKNIVKYSEDGAHTLGNFTQTVFERVWL